MITVGQPGPGAIGVPCMLMSPRRAAGKLPIMTVMLPIAIPFGAGETQAIPPGIALATAAGIPPISTVMTAAAGVIGPPTCGLGPSIIGHSAVSPARSAGPVGINSPPGRKGHSILAGTARLDQGRRGTIHLPLRAAGGGFG